VALGIGFGRDDRQERPGWDGHLVAILESTVLVDLTLDQASRPEKNIVLHPGWSVVPTSFLAGRDMAQCDMNGSRVSYSAMPADRSFTSAGDWTARILDRLDPIARVMRAVQGELPA
jgi:hypothetical protein